jgi:hypothetical protein
MNMFGTTARRTIPFILCLMGAWLGRPAVAAEPEPKFEALLKTVKTDVISLGVLFQGVGDFQIDRNFPGNNGFSVANFRINLSGQLDFGLGYFLQTNFANSPGLLDAKMYYGLTPGLSLDVGAFKAPFSNEFLTSAAGIDFVNRSRAVTALVPGRQIGLQLRGRSGNVLGYSVGLFNGNGIASNSNDNNKLMYVGRLTITPVRENDGTTEIGLNAAFGQDANATLGAGLGGGGLLRGFTGDRSLLGGDVRWTSGPYLVSGELVYASLEPDAGTGRDIYGYHITAGYMPNAQSQFLLRWDSLHTDGLRSDSDWLVLGYNAWVSAVAEIQINYIIPLDKFEIDHHQILLNSQISF